MRPAASDPARIADRIRKLVCPLKGSLASNINRLFLDKLFLHPSLHAMSHVPCRGFGLRFAIPSNFGLSLALWFLDLTLMEPRELRRMNSALCRNR